jgi:protein phosphatase
VTTDKTAKLAYGDFIQTNCRRFRTPVGAPSRLVDLNDLTSISTATDWSIETTSAGNQGIIVKQVHNISKRKHRPVQQVVKCRGPEYLRIIYGPEYLLPENLERLRARGVGAKRSLASREFALGIEALERFIRN